MFFFHPATEQESLTMVQWYSLKNLFQYRINSLPDGPRSNRTYGVFKGIQLKELKFEKNYYYEMLS
jgi:hypothetical protein